MSRDPGVAVVAGAICGVVGLGPPRVVTFSATLDTEIVQKLQKELQNILTADPTVMCTVAFGSSYGAFVLPLCTW